MSSPPAIRRLAVRLRARWPALFLVFTLISFFFIPAWGGASGRLSAYGKDLAHFPLFAALAALLLFLWPRRHSALAKAGVVAGAALLLALLVEFTQPLAGRSAALGDVLLGAAGSFAAVSVYLGLRTACDRTRRWLVASAFFLLFASSLPLLLLFHDRLSARRAFPMIDSFERPMESSRWRADGCLLEQAEEHATHGRYALRLSVPVQSERYPGAYLNDGLMDWRAYRQLTMDVFLEGTSARNLLIILSNEPLAPAADVARVAVELKPGGNRVALDVPSLAVTEDGRPLDLARIAGIGLYLDGARAGDALFLDHLRLSGRRDPVRE